MAPTLITLLLVHLSMVLSDATILYDTVMVDSSRNLSFTARINTCSDLVEAVLSGYDIPHAFRIAIISIDEIMVKHPYAMYVSNDGGAFTTYEFTSERQLTPMLNVTNRSTIDSTSILTLSRDRIGISSDHYTFPNEAVSIQIEWQLTDVYTLNLNVATHAMHNECTVATHCTEDKCEEAERV
eukprot:287349_1